MAGLNKEAGLDDYSDNTLTEQKNPKPDWIDSSDSDRSSNNVDLTSSASTGQMNQSPDRDDRSDPGRWLKYVDLTLDELTTSKTINDLRPYYSGELVDHRMGLVRDSINYIRENWELYPQHIEHLKTFLEQNGVRFDDPRVQKMLDTVLSGRKEWGQPDDLFHAIGLYTSQEGYTKLFSLVNRTFRDDEATDIKERMNNIVFLIELINIDLFNYCYRHPQHDNFQGTVYRGMTLRPQDMQAFTDLEKQSLDKRYISVPLSLWSTTSDLEVAKTFIRESDGDGLTPLIMRISVIEMKPEYMSYYRQRFPTSTVSTICAVTIKDLSMFPREFEVLLRGAFFQVLDISDGEIICGKQSKVLQMVTVNSNRDHISSVHLGEDSNLARQLFGTMVNISRCEFAIDYFKHKNELELVNQYKEILDQKKESLGKLMEQ